MRRNPDQPKGAGGRFVTRKEQRPDPTREQSSTVGTIGLDNPEYHYRTLGKDKITEEYDRTGRHKESGYTVVSEGPRRVVVACNREDHEARIAASQKESEDRLAPYERSEDGKTDFIKREMGGLPQE